MSNQTISNAERALIGLPLLVRVTERLVPGPCATISFIGTLEGIHVYTSCPLIESLGAHRHVISMDNCLSYCVSKFEFLP